MTVHLFGTLEGNDYHYAPTSGLYSDNTPWLREFCRGS